MSAIDEFSSCKSAGRHSVGLHSQQANLHDKPDSGSRKDAPRRHGMNCVARGASHIIEARFSRLDVFLNKGWNVGRGYPVGFDGSADPTNLGKGAGVPGKKWIPPPLPSQRVFTPCHDVGQELQHGNSYCQQEHQPTDTPSPLFRYPKRLWPTDRFPNLCFLNCSSI